jgi:LacI family transcriptional regulator
MKDVALAAGVSLGTVSNVLNRPDRVGSAARERVQQAIKDLGYVRNESARQLRAGRSRTLAFVVLDIANPFFADVAAGVEEVAESAGLALFVCNSAEREDRERQYLERLEQLRVQGVLITPVDSHAPLLHELPRRGIPVVIVDRVFGSSDCCTVSVDNELGGRLALDHLLDVGHRRIAFVGGPERIDQVRRRRSGALAALADAGMSPTDLLVVDTDALTMAEGRQAAQRVAGLPSRSRPTAAFCANDLLAMGFLQGCLSLGLHVPDDMAIVGYDDIDFAGGAAVPLTSVRQPRRDMGRRAAGLLIDAASNAEHRHEAVEFSPELVARSSTRRPG